MLNPLCLIPQVERAVLAQGVQKEPSETERRHRTAHSAAAPKRDSCWTAWPSREEEHSAEAAVAGGGGSVFG